ncbi:type VII secretion protein EccB [Jatrophihabitans fulvus]
MQTRRDQLQAFRFQNRRALAALVTGDPNVLEPPMRRLTVTTLSGIMIAILVVVGFTVFGFIRPKAGDAWKKPNSVVLQVDDGTQTYVNLGGVLHPTANYTSALLATGGQGGKPVKVEGSDIADARRGTKIGVPEWPGVPPASGDLVSGPITACSRQRPLPGGNELTTQVGLTIGERASGTALPSGTGVVVATKQASYLLAEGRRFAIASGRVATAMRLGQADPLQVGTAFLGAVPAGRDLRDPALEDAGGRSDVELDGSTLRVGQLLDVQDGGGSFVVLRDGIHAVDEVQRAVLSTVSVSSAGDVLTPRKVTSAAVINVPRATSSFDALRQSQLDGLPTEIPTLDRSAQANGGVCAVYAKGSGGVAQAPSFTVPPSLKPTTPISDISETGTSANGLADKVTVPPGRAAVVTASDGSPVRFLVSDSGTKFPTADTQDDNALAALGYGGVTPVRLPSALLKLIPTGPAMNRDAALTEVR